MKLENERKKVVVIGGGSGQPVILEHLKNRGLNITAIVTVADDGGSSGTIRNYMNIVPPGDIRNALAVLSNVDPEFLKIFQYRFDSSDDFFKNHSLGNLLIAAMAELEGDVFNAVQKLGKFLKVEGHVYPVAGEPLVLNAKFSDGTTAKGEHNITFSHKKIEKIWVTREDDSDINELKASKGVVDAILDADVVILGPGSLYTSILPNIAVKEVEEALIKTKAPVVYISNIMTQLGETDGYTDADHVKAINNHTREPIVNYILTNSSHVPEEYIDLVKWDEISSQVPVDEKEDKKLGLIPVVDDFLLLKDNGAFHDGKKIVDTVVEILNKKI